VCGGGRYDPLVEMFGGKPTPACGFAIGVERLLELMKANGDQPDLNQCDVYVVHQGDEAQMQAFVAAERLRDAGLDVILHCHAAGVASSFKSQMKRADASGAAFAVIIGADEVAKGQVTVKTLRGNYGEAQQHAVALEDLAGFVVGQITCDDDCDDSSHHHH
jgi:histidyl-tRNA synthetase